MTARRIFYRNVAIGTVLMMMAGFALGYFWHPML